MLHQASRSKNQPQAGFTLLEVLVVMLIIGVAFGLVTLSVGGLRFSAIKQQVDEFVALSQVAGEDAVLEGKVLGLRFDKNNQIYSYRWLARIDDERWEFLQSSTLQAAEFEQGLSLEVEIEGELLDWNQKPEKDPETGEELPSPHIVFLPGGDRSSFQVLMFDELDQQQWKIESNSLGVVEIMYEAEEDG